VIIGCAEGFTESKESWREFLAWLKGRGLKGVRMVTGDKSLGMLGTIEEVFPKARYQRCTVHFYRNVFGKVPKGKRAYVAKMLKAIHAQKSFEASMRKAGEVVAELEGMKLAAAAKTIEDGVVETLAYTNFPMQHWVRIRTNNAIERLNREIRRRIRVVGTFPEGHAALMLVVARCKYVAESGWGKRRYLDVSMLEGLED
jgi:transposase-like protein